MSEPMRPTLPPRKGYVEKVDANGQHYYSPTKETSDANTQSQSLQDQINALLTRNAELEDLIAEMAGEVYDD